MRRALIAILLHLLHSSCVSFGSFPGSTTTTFTGSSIFGGRSPFLYTTSSLFTAKTEATTLTSESSMEKPSKIKLTYFNIEGAAESSRLALALAGVDYVDERLVFEDWKELKPKTPYGQVPILTLNDNEDDKRAQSGAILRFVANTYAPDTLYPKESILEIEEVMALLDDMKHSFQPCLYMARVPEKYGYPEGFGKTEEGKELVKTLRIRWMEQEFPKFMEYLERWLDKNDNKWLATKGEQPTLADCVVVPFLRMFTKGFVDHIPTDVLEKNHPKLAEYVKRFCALPQIQGRYTDGLH